MAELEKIDFEKTVDKLLLSQYNKPNMESLFRIFAKVFEAEQEINFQLRDKFWLEDATGQQLDYLGRLWNVNRGALLDEAYRIEIYNKVAQTFSGTISEIKTIIMVLYGGTFVSYSPEYPAGYRVRTDADLSMVNLDNISAAGVKGYYAGKITHLSSGGDLVDYYGNKIIHVSPFEDGFVDGLVIEAGDSPDYIFEAGDDPDIIIEA